MRMSVVRATELTPAQLAALDARIDAPEHAKDRGACLFWHRDSALPKLFVGMLSDPGGPVGVMHVDGPLNHVHPAWWLDSRFRGQGLGAQMIDALATVLKADGYSGVGRITIDSFAGVYDVASSRLERRFRAHFPRASGPAENRPCPPQLPYDAPSSTNVDRSSHAKR